MWSRPTLIRYHATPVYHGGWGPRFRTGQTEEPVSPSKPQSRRYRTMENASLTRDFTSSFRSTESPVPPRTLTPGLDVPDKVPATPGQSVYESVGLDLWNVTNRSVGTQILEGRGTCRRSGMVKLRYDISPWSSLCVWVLYL